MTKTATMKMVVAVSHKTICQRTVIVFSVALLLFSAACSAEQTIDSLLAEDKLQVKVSIKPQQDIIARQQVNLVVEVATDRWFSRGTRIGRVEIDDAIVLQREKFSVNSTRREGNKTWTVQEWTQVVYPQRAGEFIIPSFTVNISISGASGNKQAISGVVETAPMTFTADVPAVLQNMDNWVASTRYDVESSFNQSIETLKPGDALVRTIRQSADDLPAMMLPGISVEDIPGIAIYQKPAQVVDKINRGDYLAERTETLTYVFEQKGGYKIPALIFYWWNLESGTLETIELPEVLLHVSAATSALNDSAVNSEVNMSDWSTKKALMAGLFLLLLVVTWIIWCRFRFYVSSKKAASQSDLSEKYLQSEFDKACKDKDYSRAIKFFYSWLDNFGGDLYKGSVRKSIAELEQKKLTEFNAIMQAIYSAKNNQMINLQDFAKQFIDELHKADKPHALSRFDIELKLN